VTPVTLSLVQDGLVVASSTDTMTRPLGLLLVVYEKVSEEAGVPFPPSPLLSNAMVGAEFPVVKSIWVTASGFDKLNPL
jgi:hypothetical protein